MIDNVKLTQIQKLFENENFVEQFNSVEEFAQVKQLFDDNSVNLADDELKEFLIAVVDGVDQKESKELSTEEMDDVVGGSWLAAIVIGGICAAVTGTGAYKIRKLINGFNL